MAENNENKTQAQMMDIFVKELPQLRKSSDISQTTLGQRLGLSRQTISSIERGEVPITWSVYVAAVTLFYESKNIKDSEMLNFITTNRNYIIKFLNG